MDCQGQGKAITEGESDGYIPTDRPPPNMKKRKYDIGEDQQPPLPEQKKKKKSKRKAGNKKASSKKAAPGPSSSEADDGSGGGGPLGASKVNPHRARILIGKQALAAIKEGTREFDVLWRVGGAPRFALIVLGGDMIVTHASSYQFQSFQPPRRHVNLFNAIGASRLILCIEERVPVSPSKIFTVSTDSIITTVRKFQHAFQSYRCSFNR